MELEEQMKQKLDMLDKIYNMREEDLSLEHRQDRENLKEKLNDVKLEEIEEVINDKLDRINEPEQIDKITKSAYLSEKEEVIRKIEQLIENYEIEIAYYSEKNYKRGFKDALLLYSQCIKEG